MTPLYMYYTIKLLDYQEFFFYKIKTYAQIIEVQLQHLHLRLQSFLLGNTMFSNFLKFKEI